MDFIREKGRIDISKGIDQGNITIDELERRGARNKFWFNNYQYLYKEIYQFTYEDYAELISSEIAKVFSIPCAEYDLATYDDKYGVITKNFVNDDAGEEIISGTEIINEVYYNYILPLKNSCNSFDNILKKYNINSIEDFNKLSNRNEVLKEIENIINTSSLFANMDKNMEFSEYYKMFDELKQLYNLEIIKGNNDELKINNLYDLWPILEVYCKMNDNTEQTSNQIIKDLANLFMYDIITLQGDRHTDNWAIIKNFKTNEIRLSPIYDNSNMCNLNRVKAIKSINEKVELILSKKTLGPKEKRTLERLKSEIYHSRSLLGVEDNNSVKRDSNLVMLKQFISISSKEDVNNLISKLKLLNQDKLTEIYHNIEMKTQYEIPIEVKNIVSQSIGMNIEQILQVISGEEVKGYGK